MRIGDDYLKEHSEARLECVCFRASAEHEVTKYAAIAVLSVNRFP